MSVTPATSASPLTVEHARALVAEAGNIDRAAELGGYPFGKFRRFCRVHGITASRVRNSSRNVSPDVSPDEYIATEPELLVYFILADTGGQIKIGVSFDPVRRIQELRTASPVPLRLLGTIPGGLQREAALHRQFRSHRLHAEWFDSEIRHEVAAILAREGES